MTQPTTSRNGRVPMERLALEFPRSLAVYDTYEAAQKAVDALSDGEFPVENCMIVGTDLKQVERVMGRLTWGRILTGGLLSGMWMGLFVGLLMSMFSSQAGQTWALLVPAVLVGGAFGLVWAGLGYALTRGKRDFTSVSQIVATRYEVLVEHRHFDKARDLLARAPGGMQGLAPAGNAGGTSGATATRPNPYEGKYGVRIDEAQPRPTDGQTPPPDPRD